MPDETHSTIDADEPRHTFGFPEDERNGYAWDVVARGLDRLVTDMDRLAASRLDHFKRVNNEEAAGAEMEGERFDGL